MDFAFTKEQEHFRQEVRDFLNTELPSGYRDYVGPTVDDCVAHTENGFQIFKDMARKFGEKGWLSLNWPKEYGGQDYSTVDYLIFLEEIARRGSPGFNAVGAKMLAPTLIRYGTEEQKRQHLVPISRGEEFWCESLSEPEAGSDLGALKTTAVRDGDFYIINGQKIWSTFAHYSDWCFILARTDKTATGGRGLSFFLVDLSTPGVSTAPINNLNNEPDFSEIFFSDSRIPKSNMLGEENQGWQVAQTLLSYERVTIAPISVVFTLIDRLSSYLKDNADMNSKVVEHKLANLKVEAEIGRLLGYKIAWLQDRKEATEWHAAMSRLYSTRLFKKAASEAMEIMGYFGMLGKDSELSPLQGWVQHLYLTTRGVTVAAGTAEIQKYIIATKWLGLPRG
ncbi:MAG: acyl-CoA dehydrogenase family protein [Dehalococcoidia bacterium]